MSYRIVGIGELLWDILPDGKRLGGAPANFAFHARALGADASIVSRVGADDLGREILGKLQQLALSTNFVEIDALAKTGTVSVELSADGQPEYTIHKGAWDQLDGGGAMGIVSEAQAICFGTLGQRNATARAAIRALVQRAPSAALRILDLNLRQQFFSRDLIVESLQFVNVLKLNDQELAWLKNELQLTGSERVLVEQIAKQFSLQTVALTRGSAGSLMYSCGEVVEHPGISAKVVDTIGAGDAFTATLAMGLLSRWPLPAISEACNRVAAFVCSCPGATPDLPSNLKNLCSTIPASA